jgi:outer membrane biogenesis lipoprotein LolB
MKKISRAIALLLVGSTLLSGCSMLTAQGRRERAYERYVHKSSQGRVKQQKRFAARGKTMPVTHLSRPVETTDVSGPESFGDGTEQ